MVFPVFIVVAVILFVNGLVVLGRFGGKQVAVLNLAVGTEIGITALYVSFTNPLGGMGPTQSYVVSASCLVFAFTYILLAGELFFETDFKAIGWYSCIAGIIMFLVSLGFFHILGDTLPYSTQFGLLWLLWAILFWLFWAAWGLGMSRIVKFTGGFTIFVALFTALYPAIAFFNFGRIGW
jgi:hypothetical protein